jgi:hypothetical protein
MPKYRFSGHETFPCRYAWLPKAVQAIQRDRGIFSKEEVAIAEMGVGKNMVRAIRFWVQATGVAESSTTGGYTITPFGELLLGEWGLDRFLEDRRTLWLLHWKLLSHVEEPLFAWDFLFNHWVHPEINRREVIRAFEREAKRIDRKLSPVTLEQHFEVFLHSYTQTRGRKGEVQEDNLDCPLVELELIDQVGERKAADGGRLEPVYAFRRDPKPDISSELFVFCLFDYWNRRKPNEATLTFRDVSVAHGSIGQVFKLPEWDMRDRLERLQADSNGLFSYQESASTQKVTCPNRHDLTELQLLAAIYERDYAGERLDTYVPDALERANIIANRRSAQFPLFTEQEGVAHE